MRSGGKRIPARCLPRCRLSQKAPSASTGTRTGRRAQTAGTSGAPQAAFEFEGELRALLSSAY
jgi:hypothetical protein